MKKINKNQITNLLAGIPKIILMLVLSFAWTTQGLAHISPSGCSGSGLGINFYSSISQGHIGDVISYSVTVFNRTSGVVVCDATNIQAEVVTPDGITHPISLTRTTLLNGDLDSYPNVVSFVARAEDIKPDGTLSATASDTGIIHQNTTDSQGGGHQSLNVDILNTLHVINLVANSGASNLAPSDFSVHVKNGSVESAGSPMPGSASPGTVYSLTAGTYTVSENPVSSFTQSFSGDCDSTGSVTLLAGDDKTCTVTNNFTNSVAPLVPAVPSASSTPATSSPASLHVIKLVINSTATATPADFSVHVKNADADVFGSPTPGTSTPGTLYSLIAGIYTVSEDPNASYTQSFSGDCDSTGIVTLLAGDDKTCTIINTEIPEPQPVLGGSGNQPTSTPLIGISVTASPAALSEVPGSVTYNYTVTTSGGQLALADVTVSDDLCSPAVLLSGDSNGNNKLDPEESWQYSCTTTLSQTATSTVVATGVSDDISRQTATATAAATVIVGVPGLPNTGLPPEQSGKQWTIAILTGLALLILVSLYLFLRKPKAKV